MLADWFHQQVLSVVARDCSCRLGVLTRVVSCTVILSGVFQIIDVALGHAHEVWRRSRTAIQRLVTVFMDRFFQVKGPSWYFLVGCLRHDSVLRSTLQLVDLSGSAQLEALLDRRMARTGLLRRAGQPAIARRFLALILLVF